MTSVTPEGLRIDVHTHGLPRPFPRFAERYGGSWPELVDTGPCTADIVLGGAHFRSIDDQCWDTARRLAAMDQDGVDLQVISPIPVTLGYQLPADGARELARAQNDWLADVVREHPQRFRALGAVPLQRADVAAAMVAEMVSTLGLSGVEVASNVAGAPLESPDNDEFFAACEQSGAMVFIHPWQVIGAERLRRHRLLYSVGMPAETAQAAVGLILGGVLDRFPRLQLLLAHGGGSLIGLLPRIDRVWETGPESGTGRPSSYIRRFHYDSLLFDPAAITGLVTAVGADRVLVGTDYPFALGERPAGAGVERADLSAQDRALVRGGNAVRLFGLAPLAPD